MGATALRPLMEDREHPLSPNLGGPASGAAVPPVDYFDWYFPRLYAGVEHDLSQSGFQHPWDWSALAGGSLPDDICAQFGEPLDANVWVAAREGVAPERVVVGHGVTQCLTLALLAAMEEGSSRRVAVEMPSYAPASQFPRLLGCEVVPFWRGPAHTEDTGPWLLDREGLAEMLGDVSAVVTTTPQNPTGWMMTADDQQWLADACAEAGVGIVADEVYLDSTRGTPDHRPFFTYGEHCLSVNSLTKCYGLGTLRFGWVIGSEARISAATRAMHNLQSMLSIPTLRLIKLAWPHLAEPLTLSMRRREQNLPLLLDVLAAHGIDWTPPPSGIFGCIALPEDCDAQQAIEQVAEPLGLLAIPCTMFAPQLANQIRIGWGAEPEEFQQSLAAFDEFLGRLT